MRSTAAEKRARADIGIVDAAGREIEADAAEAGLLHGVEIGLAGLVVDHGDAARGRAARLHAEQRGRIVGAIDARRHDHHALDMQRLVQRATSPRARPARACRRGPQRTETSRDRRGCGCGNRRRRPARRNSPASRAARPWIGLLSCSWQLRPRRRRAGHCVWSAWSSPSRSFDFGLQSVGSRQLTFGHEQLDVLRQQQAVLHQFLGGFRDGAARSPSFG